MKVQNQDNKMKQRDKNEIFDMVKTELLELSKVIDVSESMRKLEELKEMEESAA